MKGSSLMLVLSVLFGLANYSSSQICDIFDQQTEQCLSLPTSSFCGMPSVTAQQMRQAEAAAETVNMIQQIGGPIVEGSPEAFQLGISVDDPIIDLTSNLLTPLPAFTEEGEEFIPNRRRKRQTQSTSCCSPSPNRVRILASVDEDGRAVQLIQPPGLGQVFQDTTNCPPTSCTGEITCGAVRTLVPAEVFFLQPTSLARANIAVDICGAVTTATIG